jgi:hypothetical protein
LLGVEMSNKLRIFPEVFVMVTFWERGERM